MDSIATACALDRLCGKAGRLIISHTVAIRTHGCGFRITAGSKGWLMAGRQIVVGALLTLLIVMCMVFRRTLPGLVGALILTPLALFLLWDGLKLALCNGSLAWDDDSRDIEIRCQSVLRTRVARLPKHCVSFRAYMNTTHQDSPKLRYGDYVLALMVTSTDGAGEVVIAVLAKEAEFLKSVRALRRLLPAIECDYPEAAAGTAARRGIGEEWDKLVRKYEHKTFFGKMGIAARAAEEGFVISKGSGRWVMGGIGLGLGLCALLPLAVALRTRGFHGLGSALYLFPVAAMAIYRGLLTLSSAERITLDRLSGHFELRFGRVLFATTLIVMKERLKVDLARCSSRTATREISVGESVLSLHADTDPARKLVLTSGNHASLKEAYRVLTTFLGQPESTDALCEVPTGDGRTARFSTTAIGGDVTGNQRAFILRSPEVAAFRGKLVGSMFWVIGVAFGGLMATLPFVFGRGKGIEDRIVFFLACPLGACMFVVSSYCLIRSLIRKHVIADKAKGVLHFASALRGSSFNRGICQLSDIAAVQVCSTAGLITRPTQRGIRIVHEINVVGCRKEDDRVRVSCYTDRDKAYADAQAFARFLDVGCVDDAE